MSAHTFHLTAKSGNRKTGPAAVSTTSSDSCPLSCPLRGSGCYAESGPLGLHWRAVDEERRGFDLVGFVDALRAIPAGRPFRHNQAGDLPALPARKSGSRIDRRALMAIADASAHLDGWTYTHHDPTRENLATLRALRDARPASDRGLCVNLSADDMREADALAVHGLPVVVTVPLDHPEHSATPDGLPVVVCPVQTGKARDCTDCMLCAREDRSPIIGFRAHGGKARAVSERLEIVG